MDRCRMNRCRIYNNWFLISCFLFVFIWYARIHPVILVDSDDWDFISHGWQGLPEWKGFNPTGIFQSFLMPLAATIAMSIVQPFNEDFVLSFSIVTALFLSLFITGYLYQFSLLIKEKLCLSGEKNVIITLLFFLLHFVIFRRFISGNMYLFGSVDATCFYVYLMPTLWNCSVTMFLVRTDYLNSYKSNSPLRNGIIFLFLYLSIMSSMNSSVIPCAYIGWILILQLKDAILKREIIQAAKDNILGLSFVLMWFLMLFYVANGGLAGVIGGRMPYLIALQSVFRHFFELRHQFNHLFVYYAIVLTLLFVVAFWDKNKRNSYMSFCRLLVDFIVPALLVSLYLFLLYAYSHPHYISTLKVVFPFWFYYVFIISIVSGYFLKSYSKVQYYAPFILFLFLSQTFTGPNTYLDHEHYENAKKWDDQLISIAQKAEYEGKDSIIVFVPKFDNPVNWPISTEWYGGLVSRSFYKYNITSKEIQIRVIPKEGCVGIMEVDKEECLEETGDCLDHKSCQK